MAASKRRKSRNDWYTLDVDTLRGWSIFFVVAVGLVAAYFGYQKFEHRVLKSESERVLDEAQVLIQQLQPEPGLTAFRSEFESALSDYRAGRDFHRADAFGAALSKARASRNLLDWIDGALSHREAMGEAQFISVWGRTEYRRGEAGDWQTAKSRVPLRYGDYVRTGTNGSAEIMFTTGTLYTLRPESLIFIDRKRVGLSQEQSIEMQYGWVNLNTSRAASRVKTPTAEAAVKSESEATVAYDSAADRGRFEVYRGGLSIASNAGGSRDLGELEQVLQNQDDLSPARRLPARPVPLAPGDNAQFDFGRDNEVRLSWEPVSRAVRYALQVSRNHLFVDNVIDVSDRGRPEARVGIRSEGVFQWRVAAIDREGLIGPWSVPRMFRSAAFRGGLENDETPPDLSVDEITAYGHIFIVSGTTEPGATVEINGEPVTVSASGAFTKTIQVLEADWSFITIIARDAWGNEVERRRRVFVEAY